MSRKAEGASISSKSYGKRPVFLTCFTIFAAAANVRPPFKSNARTSNTYSRQRRRPHINLGRSLAAPQLGCACRRGERPFGPSRIRPCGLTAALRLASRFARLASTSLPGRSAGLRSGLFCGAKRSRRFIRLPRPVGPFACSGRANLPSKHTHMSVEAYPPDGPQISPRQGSQNFSARAGSVARGGLVREGAQVSDAARGKLLRPASRRLRRP